MAKILVKNWFSPCPFCGGSELDLTTREDFRDMFRKRRVGISCDACGVTMWEYLPAEEDRTERYDDITERLRAKWNKRNGKAGFCTEREQYLRYLTAGFTPDQSFELLKIELRGDSHD